MEKEEASGGKQVVEEKENDEACCSKQVNADTTEFEPGKNTHLPLSELALHMLLGPTCYV